MIRRFLNNDARQKMVLLNKKGEKENSEQSNKLRPDQQNEQEPNELTSKHNSTHYQTNNRMEYG